MLGAPANSRLLHRGAFCRRSLDFARHLFFLGQRDHNNVRCRSKARQTWLQTGVSVRPSAFFCRKQAPGRVCHWCTHRISNIAAMTPPLREKKVNNPTGEGAASFSGPLRFELIGAHAGRAPVRRRCRALTWWGASQNGPTPLHDAAGKGDLEVVRSLLAAGANKDARGNTALAWVGAVF